MSTTRVKCGVCGQDVYRNAKGQILTHTGRPDYRKVMDVCSGSSKGARP